MNRKRALSVLFCLVAFFANMFAQDKLYTNTFPLGQVKLLEGPFKHACDLNVQILLQYDVDRLLAPFLKEARVFRTGKALMVMWADIICLHWLSIMQLRAMWTVRNGWSI